MWSVGCILAELLDTTPLFTGASDFDQLARIARFIGAPNHEVNWFVSNIICSNRLRVQKQVPEFARLNLPDAKIIDVEKYFEHRLCQQGGLEAANLLSKLLVYDGEKRLSVDQAL